jgi:hypothetical protein
MSAPPQGRGGSARTTPAASTTSAIAAKTKQIVVKEGNPGEAGKFPDFVTQLGAKCSLVRLGAMSTA